MNQIDSKINQIFGGSVIEPRMRSVLQKTFAFRVPQNASYTRRFMMGSEIMLFHYQNGQISCYPESSESGSEASPYDLSYTLNNGQLEALILYADEDIEAEDIFFSTESAIS